MLKCEVYPFEKLVKSLVIIRFQCPAEISPWRKFS